MTASRVRTLVCTAACVSALASTRCSAPPSTSQPAASVAGEAGTSSPSSIELQQFDFGGDFTLGTAPQRFSLADHRGDVVLVFFGYTFCPDICPTTLGTLAKAQALLGDARERTFVAFVSVDPQRDTPARLEEYTRHFGVRGTGVTGTKADIDALVAQYSAFYEIQPSQSAMGYMVDHTSRIYLVDPAGKVRYLFRSTDSPEQIAAGIRAVLQEAS